MSGIALDIVANPTTFLSTVQVGITLIGVLAGAGELVPKQIAVDVRDQALACEPRR
jgi:hypothetical protein